MNKLSKHTGNSSNITSISVGIAICSPFGRTILRKSTAIIIATTSVPYVHFFETPEFAFIVLNPHLFPFQEDCMATIDNKIVEMFEQGLAKFANREVFVFMYFPVCDLSDPNEGRSLHRLKDIIDRSNAHMLVTGPNNPQHAVPQHHGRALEIMVSGYGPGQAMWFTTLDNGCAVFHTVNLSNELPNGFITNPVPFEQISKKSVFNEENLTIRVIALTQDDSVQTDVNIDGKHLGYLKFERVLRPNTSLWTFSTRLSKGKHTLRLTGSVSESMEFYGDRRYCYFEERSASIVSIIYQFVVTIVSFFAPWFVWYALKWAVKELVGRNEVRECPPAPIRVSIPLWVYNEMGIVSE